MVAEAGWFGSAQRPLFGWVHTPPADRDRTARGAVVLCPAFGLEATYTYTTMRLLAQRLAELGFVCVRFDYDGYGDSAGRTDDPDRVNAWQSSVGQAIELARSLTDRPLTVVGMRAGALLAAYEAKRKGGVDALVLWDVPRSGRSYVRELRTRHTISFGDDPQQAPALSFMGADFAPDTVTALETLDMRSFERLPAHRALLVQSPGRGAISRQALESAADAITVIESAEQDELILRGQVPPDTLGQVASWFDRTFADSEYATHAEPALAGSTTAMGVDASAVIERVVAIGPHRLFGIVCEPADATSALRGAPAMVFVPDAITPHIGLGRMWVELARTWAAAGLRVVRYDGSGNGDSEARPGDRINTMAALSHFDDVREVAAEASPDDPTNVVLLGTCLGGYQCLEAALESALRGICIMNPAFVVLPAEQPESARRQARQMPRRGLARLLGKPVGAIARRLSPNLKHQASFDWDRWFVGSMWQSAVLRRTSKVPDPAWRIVNRLLLRHLPADVLRRVVDRGGDVLLVLGDPDHDLIRLGTRRRFARLEQRANFTLAYLPELDHSVMKSGQRQRLMAVVTEHIMDRFATSAARRTSGTADGTSDSARATGDPALILSDG